MFKERSRNRTKEIIILSIIAFMTMMGYVLSLCEKNYDYVHSLPYQTDLERIKSMDDLNLDWCVVERDTESYKKIGLSKVQYRAAEHHNSKSPIVEFSDNSMVDQFVECGEVPYKIHIVKAVMADENDISKGVYISSDSYTDSDGVMHAENRLILLHDDGGNTYKSLLTFCYKQYVEEKFGTVGVSVIGLLPYIPLFEHDPYLGNGYIYWNDSWKPIVAVFFVYIIFMILVICDKSGKYLFSKIFAAIAILFLLFYCGYIFHIIASFADFFIPRR